MNNPTIVIENIKEEDLDEIIQIGLTTPELQVAEESPGYYPKEMLESFIQSPDDIYLVAKIDGKIAGYRIATYNKYMKEAYLSDIVVKPEYRGHGVATKLYEKTFEILNKKKCYWIWALVRDTNTNMSGILQKKGFHKGEKFNFFYKLPPF